MAPLPPATPAASPQADHIRALLAELFAAPAAEVRAALGVTPPEQPTIDGEPAPVSYEQHVADETAAGLMQLGWLVRRHPRLAEGLQWELSGLQPAMVVARAELAPILATARTVGATIGEARHAAASPGPLTGAVIELSGLVRVLLTTPRPVDDYCPAAL